MTLEEIATHYGTAKVPHGYMPIYEKYFEPIRHNSITLLEIGVATGASIKTWSQYFTMASIIGVDKHLIYNSDECALIEGDASSIETISVLKSVKYNIIIDDGSHIAQEQLKSFEGLWDSVLPGGYYIIEDLFALYDPVWNNTEDNIINMISSRMKSILTGGDSIQEVHYYGRNDINGIMFLRKRNEEFRIQPLEEFNMTER